MLQNICYDALHGFNETLPKARSSLKRFNMNFDQIISFANVPFLE